MNCARFEQASNKQLCCFSHWSKLANGSTGQMREKREERRGKEKCLCWVCDAFWDAQEAWLVFRRCLVVYVFHFSWNQAEVLGFWVLAKSSKEATSLTVVHHVPPLASSTQ
jgi:hypothetical protein